MRLSAMRAPSCWHRSLWRLVLVLPVGWLMVGKAAK
jgi:uncharacterized protein YbdZ (MbtH family)